MGKEFTDIFNEIQDWVKKGYLIEYYIVDQYANGYKHEVISGRMARYTYTAIVLHNEQRIFAESHDTIGEALQSALNFMEKAYVFKYKLRDHSIHTIRDENIYEAMTQIVKIHNIHPTDIESIEESIILPAE